MPSLTSAFNPVGASTSSSNSSLDGRIHGKIRERSLLASTIPVKWCGQRNSGQDVCIRLVRSSIDDGGWSTVLVYVIAHSSRLMACSQYFAAELAKSLNTDDPVDKTNLFFDGDESAHSLLEVTLHVDTNDSAPYIDCISRICKPSKKGLEDIPENIIPLLRAATHIAYDALMSHICRQQDGVDVLAEPRKQGLHLLISTCFRSPKEIVKDLITQLLKRAREQHWRPTPTFEQELVAIVNEELKRLLAEASNECDWKTPANKDKVPDFQKLTRISDLLKALLGAQIASEGVRCLLQYPTIPKFLRSLWSQEDDVVAVVRAFVVTALSVYKGVVAGYVVLRNSDRYALVKHWIKFLENIDVGFVKSEELDHYEETKTAILSSLLDKQQLDILINHADKNYYYTFGRPEALLNLLKRMMARNED